VQIFGSDTHDSPFVPRTSRSGRTRPAVHRRRRRRRGGARSERPSMSGRRENRSSASHRKATSRSQPRRRQMAGDLASFPDVLQGERAVSRATTRSKRLWSGRLGRGKSAGELRLAGSGACSSTRRRWDAVVEFTGWNRQQIIIRRCGVGNPRIGGTFRPDNVEGLCAPAQHQLSTPRGEHGRWPPMLRRVR